MAQNSEYLKRSIEKKKAESTTNAPQTKKNSDYIQSAAANKDNTQKYRTGFAVSNVLSQFDNKRQVNPQYQSPDNEAQQIAQDIEKQMESSAAPKMAQGDGIFSKYSRGVNEGMAALWRGVGMTVEGAASGLNYLGAKGVQSAKKMDAESEGGLWKYYQKAGEWLAGAGEATRKSFNTERSLSFDASFNEDPLKAIGADPFGFALKAAEQVPMTVALMLPGIGVSGAVANTARVARMGTLTRYAVSSGAGAAVMRPIEGLMEAGQTYEEAKAKGMSEDEAIRAGGEVFAGNLALVGVDALQIMALTPAFKYMAGAKSLFARIGVEALEIAGAGLSEGGEELYQSYLQKKALGEDFDIWGTESQQAFLLGMVGGVVFQVAGSVMEKGDQEKAMQEHADDVIDKLPPSTKDEIKRAVNEKLTEDMTEEQKTDVRLDALENLAKENEAAVSVAVKEVNREMQEGMNESTKTEEEVPTFDENTDGPFPEATGDIMDEINQALGTVTGNQEQQTDMLDNLDEGQQAIAGQLWADKYQADYEKIETEVRDMQQQLKAAKGTERENLIDEIAMAGKRQGELEEAYRKDAAEQLANSKKPAQVDAQAIARQVEEVASQSVPQPPIYKPGAAGINKRLGERNLPISVSENENGKLSFFKVYDEEMMVKKEHEKRSGYSLSKPKAIEEAAKYGVDLNEIIDKTEQKEDNIDNETRTNDDTRGGNQRGAVAEDQGDDTGRSGVRGSDTQKSDGGNRSDGSISSDKPGERPATRVEKPEPPKKEPVVERGTKEAAKPTESGVYTTNTTTPIAAKQGTMLGKAIVKLFENNGKSLEDESAYFTVDLGQEGMMPLSVERLPDNRVAISNTFTQNGDLMRDPEVVFSIEPTIKGNGQLVAKTIEHPPMHIFGRDLVGPVPIKPNDSFLATWARNLDSQGYLDAVPGKQQTGVVDEADIKALEADMRSIYLNAGESDIEGYKKIDAVLSEIMTLLELAEPGYKLQNPDTLEFSGVPSTFPKWIPDNARTSEDVYWLMQNFDDVHKFSYPTKRIETKRRNFVNELFEQLDIELDVSTSVIREEIMKIYEQYENKAIEITRAPEKTTESRGNGAAGDTQREEREGGGKQADLSVVVKSYDNAEEFARSVIYHGTNENYAPKILRRGFKVGPGSPGVSFSWDFETALSYTDEGETGYRHEDVIAAVPIKGAENIGTDGVDKLTGEDIYAPEDVVVIGNGQHSKEDLIKLFDDNKEKTLEEMAADKLAPVQTVQPEQEAVERLQRGESVKATDLASAMGIEVNEVKLTEEPKPSDEKIADDLVSEDFVPAGGREREGATGRGLLDQYWTPPEAVDMTYAMLRAIGVNMEGAMVLEPSVGMGNFLTGLPQSANVTGFEIDQKAAQALKIKRPDVAVINMPFERVFMDDSGNKHKVNAVYDLVVGNPPYGKHRGLFKGLGEEPKIAKYENYFIKRSLDVTKEGGYVAMVVPSAFLRNSASETGKKLIAERGELVAAMRLPNGAFETTDIGTDILIFKKNSLGKLTDPYEKTKHENRVRLMSDNNYFNANEAHVLGAPGERSGRFGVEPYVDGSMEAAVELFSVTDYASKEPAPVIIEENYVDIDTGKSISAIQELTDADLIESVQKTQQLEPVEEQERRIKEQVKKIQQQPVPTKVGQEYELPTDEGTQRVRVNEVRGNRAYYDVIDEKGNKSAFGFTDVANIEENAKPVEKTEKKTRTEKKWREPAEGMLDLRTLTDKNAYDEGQWKYVQPDGSLAGDFDTDRAYYMGGKYYNEFNYAQGNIYQKLEQLENDKAALTDEKYEKQKAVLEAVLPEPMPIDNIYVSPHTRFTEEIKFGADSTLKTRFIDWVRKLPLTTFGDSNAFAVIGYTNGEPVRGGDKQENAKNRRTRRIVGDKLFRSFLIDELSETDQRKVINEYNRRFNGYHKPDYTNVPLTAKISKMYNGNELVLSDVQRQGIGFLLNRGVGLLGHDVGLGKDQPLTAKILTPDGWKTMGDMKIGETVISKTGQPTKVTGVYPQGKRPVYKVTFNDDTSTECGEEHLWSVQTPNKRCKYKDEWLTKTTKELIEAGLYNDRGDYVYSIPVTKAVYHEKKDATIPPYLMGVLIGDGGLAGMGVVVSTPDEHILTKIKNLIPETASLTKKKGDNCDYTLSYEREKRADGQFGKSDLIEKLRVYGLWGHKANKKFIPKDYLITDIESRIALLQGLLDTDGYASKNGTVQYTTVSKQLKEDVKELVWSLGGTVREATKVPTYTYKGEKRTGQLAYTLTLCLPPDFEPFTLPRKKERVVERTKYLPIRYIKSIEYVREDETQCIMVDCDTHTYVTDQYIVTHNTLQGVIANLELIERGWAKRPLIIAPNQNVYKQWISDFKQLRPDIQINELANLGRAFKGDLATLEIPAGSISVITQEGFKRLRFKEETYNRMKDLFNDVIEDPDAGDKKKTERAKELQAAQTAETIGKMRRKTKDERLFEDLGFDAMTYDEIHNANHIIGKVKTKKGDELTGEFNRFGLTPSQVGLKTWLASQYIQEQNNGRNVIGLSATPFTNHPLEYYSIMSLFARQTMEDMGILNAADFMAMFMDVTSRSEYKAKGDFEERADVRNFKNMLQFQQLITQFIDFRDGEEAGVIRPNRISREFTVPENRLQLDIKQAVQELFRDTRNGGQLKAIGDLQLATITPYAAESYTGEMPSLEEFIENSPKLKLVIEMISNTVKGVKNSNHIVYAPKGVDGKFPTYQLMKEYMVKHKGFKPGEVEIITGKTPKDKRSTIQENFNAGKVRVILGSAAIEEGINLQERTTDLYMIGQPWNFTAVRQVIGRAWRQKNKWRNVRINQVFTENSIDVFMAQKLETKQRRYEEALKSKQQKVDVGDLEYEELIGDLLTDPVMRAKVEYDNMIGELHSKAAEKESDFAYQNRKNEQYIKAWEKLAKARRNKQEHPDWEYLDGIIKNAEENLQSLVESLTERGVDVTAIKENAEKTQGELEALNDQIEKLEKKKEAAIKVAEQERVNMADMVTDFDVTEYIQKRKEDDDALFLTGDPMFRRMSRQATLKTIEDLRGRTKVSRQYITDMMKRPDIKQAEKDLVLQALDETEGAKIDVEAFIGKLQTMIVPLDFVEHDNEDLETRGGYYNVALPEELRGPLYNYNERVWRSPIETQAGQVHQNLPYTGRDRYFAHTRYEDMSDGFLEDGTPSYDEAKVRRVIEVQSDLMQKGRLEQEIEYGYGIITNINSPKPYGVRMPDGDIEDFYRTKEEANKMIELMTASRRKDIESLQPYRNSWWQRIIREEMALAATDKMKEVQFPVGKTAMIIEGLGNQGVNRWRLVENGENRGNNLTPENMQVGQELFDLQGGLRDSFSSGSGRWIVTKVLDEGLFEAVPKSAFESAGYYETGEILAMAGKTDQLPEVDRLAERFDISGGADTNNPIYKFYEKEVGQFLQKQFNAKRKTDAQGVEWWSVPVDGRPILAFNRKLIPLRDEETGQWRGSMTVDEINELERQSIENELYDAETELGSDYISDYGSKYVEGPGERRVNALKQEGRKGRAERVQYTMRAATKEELLERIADYSKRFGIEVQTEFAPAIFTGSKSVVESRINKARAYAVSWEKGIAFSPVVGKTAADHEMTHQVIDRMVEKVGPFKKFTRAGLYREAYLRMMKDADVRKSLENKGYTIPKTMPKIPANVGSAMDKNTKEEIKVLEEYIAEFAELYQAEIAIKKARKAEMSMLERFVDTIREALTAFGRLFGPELTNLAEFYRTMESGKVGAIERFKNRKELKLDITDEFAGKRKMYRYKDGRSVKYLDFGNLGAMKRREDAEARSALYESTLAPATNQPEVINAIKKDINLFENLLAQSRDIYLKDTQQFRAADRFEQIAEQQDADKMKLDRFFADMLMPYMKLKKEDRARVDELLWRGDATGHEFSSRELIMLTQNEAQQEAYRGVREALNMAHDVLLTEMKNKGISEDEIDAFRREREGYMPHKWQHPYVVKHQRTSPDGQGTTTYMMESFPSQKAAEARAAQLQKESNDTLQRFVVDKLSSLEVDFFSSMELTQERMGAVITQMREKGYVKDEVGELLKSNLMDMFKEKGFGRHYLRRTGVGGFDTQRNPEILAQYFTGFSGYIAKMRHSSAYFNALSRVDARRQPRFWEWLQGSIAYKLANKPEDIHIPIPLGKGRTFNISLRALTFSYFLANDLSYLLTNATQNFVVGMGELSKYTKGADKIIGPEKRLLGAMFDYSAGRLTPDERLTIDMYLANGELGAEMSAELSGFKDNPVYREISARYHKVLYKSTAVVEQNVNRVPAFLAAYRLFQEQGMNNREAQVKALEVSNDIHFRYGRQHRPKAFRGRLSVLFVFQHYIRSFLFQLYRDSSRGEYAALTRKMLYTTALGGTLALPFAKLILSIFRGITGDDDEEEDIVKELDTWEIILTRGLPAGLIGVDLSSRVGIGLMSVESIFDNPTDVRSYIGATGSLLFKRLPQGIELIGQGRYVDAGAKLLPDVAANPLKAAGGFMWGVRSNASNPLIDANGEVYKYSTLEAIIRATGFTPTKEAVLWDQYARSWDAEARRTETRTTLRRTIQGMVQRGEIEEARELQSNALDEGLISETTDYVRQFAEDKFYTEAVEGWQTSDKRPVTLEDIEDELINNLYNGRASDLQRNNVRKELAVYRQYDMDNPYVSDIMGLRTNTEKIDYLLDLRENLGADDFREFYEKGRGKIKTEAGNRVPILFSDNLHEDLVKAINDNAL
jgi:hypothetical protein